jgi:hypothetical protein
MNFTSQHLEITKDHLIYVRRNNFDEAVLGDEDGMQVACITCDFRTDVIDSHESFTIRFFCRSSYPSVRICSPYDTICQIFPENRSTLLKVQITPVMAGEELIPQRIKFPRYHVAPNTIKYDRSMNSNMSHTLCIDEP